MLGSLRIVSVRGPVRGFNGGSLRRRSWAACAAVVWRVQTRSLRCPVSRTARLWMGDSVGALGLFREDTDTGPFWSEDATPGSHACVPGPAPLGRVGRAGLPGAFWCGSSFFFVAGPVALIVCSAPSRLGLPCLWLLLFFSPVCAPVVSGIPCAPDPGALGLGVLWFLRPPSAFFSLPPPPSPFFFCLAFLYFLFVLFFLSASSRFFVFFSALVCPLCGTGLVCVSSATGCSGVCCCGRCAPAGAGLRLRCVVRCSLVVPIPCVLLPVGLRVSAGAMLAAFLFPVLSLVPCLCALSSGPVLRRCQPVVALGCCGGVALLRGILFR